MSGFTVPPEMPYPTVRPIKYTRIPPPLDGTIRLANGNLASRRWWLKQDPRPETEVEKFYRENLVYFPEAPQRDAG